MDAARFILAPHGRRVRLSTDLPFSRA
jgi:hypothetical protein